MKTILALFVFAFALEAFSIKPKNEFTEAGGARKLTLEKTFKKNKIKSYSNSGESLKNVERYSGKKFEKVRMFTKNSGIFNYVIKYHVPVVFKNPYSSISSWSLMDMTFYKTEDSILSSKTKLIADSLIDVMNVTPVNLISDYSDVISWEVEKKLNVQLSNYSKNTGVNIMVLTIPTIGIEINHYNFIQYIFDSWGISAAENTILIIIFTDEEKLGVYSTGELMGALLGMNFERFEDRTLLPLCRDSDYDSAILRYISDLTNLMGNKSVGKLKSEYRQALAEKDRVIYNVFFAVLSLLLIIAFVFLVLVLKKIT